MTVSYEGLTNELLGYRADARLLIVNADDSRHVPRDQRGGPARVSGGDRLLDEPDDALPLGGARD